jgi:ribosomal protein L15
MVRAWSRPAEKAARVKRCVPAVARARPSKAAKPPGRLPHGRGYSQKARDTGHFGTRLAVVKLSRLSQWDANVEITPESLRERGVLKALRDGVKILGDGGPSVALPSGLRFRDVLFSKGAREALVAAGADLEETAELSS